MSQSSYPSADERKAAIEAAADDAKNAPLIDLRVWCPFGEEHIHPEGFEIWKPACVVVEGDFTDRATLRVLNTLMEEHNLKVHRSHGHAFCEKSADGYARLVLDPSGWS